MVSEIMLTVKNRIWALFRVSCFVGFALYGLMISGNIATWRNLRTWSFSSLSSNTSSIFILPDVAFTVLPYHSELQIYADVLLLLSGVACLILLLWRRPSILIWSDLIWCEGWLVLMKAVAQVLTTLPDANLGNRAACLLSSSTSFSLGTWVLQRITHDFCGDMIWSGHTSHMILAHVFMWRLLSPLFLVVVEPVVPDEKKGNGIEKKGEKKGNDNSIDMPSLQKPTTRRLLVRYALQFLSVAACLLLMVLLLLARIHYTVDIFLATIATLTLTTHASFLETGHRFLLLRR